MMRRVCLSTAWFCRKSAPMMCFPCTSPTAVWGGRQCSTTPSLSDLLKKLNADIHNADEEVRRRKADVDAVTLYLAESKNIKPPMPTNADNTTRALWNRMKWTDQDLRDTKQDLDLAYQSFDRAYQLLRDAKRDLANEALRQPVGIDLEKALDQFVCDCSQMELSKPCHQVERRCGGGVVQERILSHFMRKNPTTMQASCALALRLPSGVGKTYLSFCFPAGNTRRLYKDKKWRHICIYAGFNSECKLTLAEKRFFYHVKNEVDAVAASAVGLVVMARVVGQLAAFIAAGCPERPDDTDLHLFAPNLSADALLGCHKDEYDTMTGMLIKRAVQQLCDVHKVHTQLGSIKTTVLVNVDEAQLLDEQLMNDQRQIRGARFALRVLRQLQLAVSETRQSIALLGMSTGINPEVSLTNDTLGANFAIDEKLLSREECVDLALGYQSQAEHPPEPSWRVMIAHRLYPRVRNILWAIDEDERSAGSAFSVTAAAEDVATLIKHHITKEPLDYRFIPENFVTTACNTDSAIPYIDVAMWPGVLGALSLAQSTAPYTTKISQDVFNCYDFEKSAFRVLWFTMMVYFSNKEVLRDVGEAFRQQQSYFTNALGLSSTLNMKGSPSRLECNELPHPFASSSQLSSQFMNKFKELKKDGDALLLYLGRNSAADYMLLHKDGDTIKVWYGDAKTHVGKSTDPTNMVKRDAKAFKDKMDKVHEDLRSLLPELDPKFHCSIITHVALKDDDKISPDVTVLCPTTFVCEPWSSILFGEAAALEEAEGRMPVTEYKMYGSRF